MNRLRYNFFFLPLQRESDEVQRVFSLGEKFAAPRGNKIFP